MHTTNTLIIGAGQAGLATASCLQARGVDHLIVDRGRIAERWRSERWDSLQLLTPNWMTRLPGWAYDGPDPADFMTAAEVTSFLERYAASIFTTILEHTNVSSVDQTADGFTVTTNGPTIHARNVIIATGWCDVPAVPHIANGASAIIHQLTPSTYRNPKSLPDGGILIVGASSSGVQLADELVRAGRDVLLAVGRHSRLPRQYRGMDIHWWLDRLDVGNDPVDTVPDVDKARAEPSAQLIGRADHRDVDLPALRDVGVRLAGRLLAIDGHGATFADDLATTTTRADRRLTRVLDRIDRHVIEVGLDTEVDAKPVIRGLGPTAAPTEVSLRQAGINTVIWATGFRRTYDWLHVPVLDPSGEISQHRGVTSVAGVYVVGQRYQQHRNSNFIDGVGRDACDVAEHIDPTTRHITTTPTTTSPDQK